MVSQVVVIFAFLAAFIGIYVYYEQSVIDKIFQLVMSQEGNVLETGERIFTKRQLKLYNGIDKPELYLCIMGEVYDVTKGAEHYAKGAGYNVFIGQDSSRSFVTGKFKPKDVSDIVHDFNFADLRSINHWVGFYRNDYTYVGKLIGRYYDKNGARTNYGERVWSLIEQAEQEKNNENETILLYPPCNVEWDASSGTRVWCTDKSGGIQRDWIGYPRQLYEADQHAYRCTCVKDHKTEEPTIKLYDDCDTQASSCYVKENDDL